MFSSNKAFSSGKWMGEIKYFTDFQERVFHLAESKGIRYILNLKHDMPEPDPITESYIKVLRDSDIVLSMVRSSMGTIPQSMVQDLLDRKDLSSRAKTKRVLRRLSKDREANMHTAIEEIENDLSRLVPVKTFLEAQLLTVDILDAQRLLTNLGQPMADTRMKQLLFKYAKSALFDAVTTEIDKNRDWTFARARKEFDDYARRWKVRNSTDDSEVPVKRNKVEDVVPFTVMAAYTQSTEKQTCLKCNNEGHVTENCKTTFLEDETLLCFNCKNSGHISNNCKATFCGKCHTRWPSISHPQRHVSGKCTFVAVSTTNRGNPNDRQVKGRNVPAARVCAISAVTNIDPFADDFEESKFESDFALWNAAQEFENKINDDDFKL